MELGAQLRRRQGCCPLSLESSAEDFGVLGGDEAGNRPSQIIGEFVETLLDSQRRAIKSIHIDVGWSAACQAILRASFGSGI